MSSLFHDFHGLILCHNLFILVTLTALPVVAVQRHVCHVESVNINQILENVPAENPGTWCLFVYIVWYMGVTGFRFTRALKMARRD